MIENVKQYGLCRSPIHGGPVLLRAGTFRTIAVEDEKPGWILPRPGLGKREICTDFRNISRMTVSICHNNLHVDAVVLSIRL